MRKIILALAITLTPLAAPLATPVEAASKYPCPKYHKLLRKHGLPVRIFAPIMARESRCVTRAIGWNYHKGKSHLDCKLSHARTYRHCKAVKSYDIGLLQINSQHKTLTAQVCKTKLGRMFVLQDPECNLKVAAKLYNKGKGLSNWQGTSGSRSGTR
jgi:hypothetical protein